MSGFLKKSYLKLNSNSAHKYPACNGIRQNYLIKRRNKTLFSGSNFYIVVFFAAQRVIGLLIATVILKPIGFRDILFA